MSPIDRRIAGELPSGALKLYDRYLPGLAAGAHRLVVQQTITVGGHETHHYYRDQRFVVKAPRFAVPGEDLHGRFPPEGGKGNYGRNLPYLVLRNRALPWERRPGNGAPDDAPWLALLVLSQAELEAAGGTDILKIVSVAEVMKGEEPGLLRPNLEDEADDADGQVQVIDLPIELFRAVAPTPKELPLLAHLRCVNTDDKAPQQMDVDGEYAVLVANRFPTEGINHVFLISMEGQSGWLTREAPPDARVRLVSPARWSFQMDSSRHDTFGSRAVALSSDVFGLRPPIEDRSVARALGRAYTPLTMQTRTGAKRSAWYRGPFTPIADGTATESLPGGYPDLSHECAFQLGRLLALSSPSFVQGLRTFLDSRQDQDDAARRIHDFIESHGFAEEHAAMVRDPAVPSERSTVGRELIDWLARLVLLYPVPFHYLVPNAELLPEESLRFFLVDDHWQEALARGALSTAIRCSRDRREQGELDYSKALSRVVHQHRRRLLGKELEGSVPDDFMEATKSGFLLRSRLVSDWTGLEVEVETSDDDPRGPSSVLRLDHLGDGVMLGLVRGRIRKVTLKEPKEALSIGVSTGGELTPLDASNLEPVKGAASIAVKGSYLREGEVANVLKLGELVGELVAATHDRDFGPADLALQLLIRPESQSFVWKT